LGDSGEPGLGAGVTSVVGVVAATDELPYGRPKPARRVDAVLRRTWRILSTHTGSVPCPDDLDE
jgi:hypothetical protein